MKAASAFGALVRRVSRTGAGRSAGTMAYRVAAELAARRLARLGPVASVYLTGSLAGENRVEPGYSDIDLVAVMDARTVEEELRALEHLRAFQRRARVLGGLFYNLDCLDVRELDCARAFGGAFEMRLDRAGRCLAGARLWKKPAHRPVPFERREWFAVALRRWINTGARLLDPSTDRRGPEALRAARRLVVDLAALWAGVDLATWPGTLARAIPEGADLPSTRELAARGVAHAGPDSILSLLLPSVLEMLGAFAREVTADFEAALDVAGAPERGASGGAPELEAVARGIHGAPFGAVLLVRKGVVADDRLPLVLVDEGTPARHAVEEFAARLARVGEPLAHVTGRWRRPVPITKALWGALALAEPAPFLAAAAMAPLYRLGPQPPSPPVPRGDAFAELLRTRVVQSFVNCRGVELRPKRTDEHVRRAVAERFALLDALDRAIDGDPIPLWPTPAPPPASERERVERLRRFRERHLPRLAPLLPSRL